jgi:hypothetical protein
MSEHINIERAWFLIQECSSISLDEAAHLNCCDECRDFLKNLVSVTRYVGFSVRFPTGIDARVDRERAA